MTKTSRRSYLSLLALAALVGVSVGGYRLWTLATSPSRLPAAAPDDLAMLASLDAGKTNARAVLLASSGKLFAVHGDDGAIDSFTFQGRPAGNLVRIGEPILGAALGRDALWVTVGHAVRRVPLDGTAPTVVTDRLGQPRAIAAGPSALFVVDVDGSSPGMLPTSRVLRIVTATGQTTALGQYQGEVPNVVFDRGAAYWSDPLEGSIFEAPELGGEPQAIASGRGLPENVAVVGNVVVWVEKRSESLWSVPKGGGTSRSVVQDFAGFSNLIADGNKVAWVNEAAVDGSFRVLTASLDEGAATPASPPVDGIEAIASDGTRLFWFQDGVAREIPPVPAAAARP